MAEDTPRSQGRRRLTVEDYFDGIRAANVATLARGLTLIESHNPSHRLEAEQLLTKLLPYTGQAIRVGITGAPGVGKSTFIEALGMHLIEKGMRVAVLAVDPSSGISGGSILGDKTRMAQLSAHPDAYIRPAPSAGTLGGVATRTRESMLVCEAAGYQAILVETVGVGQSETMVADMTDCFLGLMLPGAGDELQGIKRGLLELVDVIAVNKADGSMKAAAEYAAHQYDVALKSLSGRSTEDAAPEVLTCSALKPEGIDRVWQSIENCYQRQQESGSLASNRGRQNLRWMWTLVEQQLHEALHSHSKVEDMQATLQREVVAGAIPPEVGARRILEAVGLPLHNGQQPITKPLETTD